MGIRSSCRDIGPIILGETTGGWKAEGLPIIPESFVYEFNEMEMQKQV